jgi:hypothetical protein
MESVDRFKDSNRDDITQHEFHFIGGPRGTGKSALFRKLHAACRSKGVLIAICAAMSLAPLLFDGATTVPSLFSYPVDDESNVDYKNVPICEFNKERAEILHEVSVIFWDEFISNDRILMESVLDKFRTTWESKKHYIIVYAGNFVQVYFMPTVY